MDNLLKLLKLLSDFNRLSILFALEDDSCSVSEIIVKTNMSQPLISFHLKILKEAKLVTAHRKSTFIYYSLTNKEILTILKELNVFSQTIHNKHEEEFKNDE